ncbi:TauD/TfdA family dioxygenase [Xenorhabdus bovienii]|uniref:Taurine catabolism dioxygenase TauD/TfdA n=1 Tax=Xenorhabdus bovienii str. kraussei Becker Underwood TaxID=1398204 RepID=A0A077PU51_XENBV|nr:TauD/TfdA family dioxygenase [Xenorhabdus bovienii]CDH24553.1 Taurine catabolism dioxygenase TauD/TfdA [Xenorhabdus bovienii str. kraussei Becker Underwood]
MITQQQPSFDSYFRQPTPCYGFECIYAVEPNTHILASISTYELYGDLAHSGVVIYSGFSDTLTDFNEFISAHSERVTFDPARKAATTNTAEIDAGLHEMGLHRENGNLPFNPDLQWFFCLAPASLGSETTMCDGQRVLFDLSPKTRKLFQTRKIRYSRRIPWSNVKRFLSVELQRPIEEISDNDLELVNQQIEGQTYRRIDQNLIHSQLVISAIETSCFSGKEAFCNSMLGPSVNYEPPLITWENGDDIPLDIWDEIKEVTARNTYNHFWKKGDIVVIDNTRVMHGRRRLDDPSRRIFGAQSYRIVGNGQ